MPEEAGPTNSFTTLAEANIYFDNQFNRYALWNALTEDNKNRLLIEATEMLTYGLDWNIEIDPDDYSESTIPQKNACCEQAWAIYGLDRQADPETAGIAELTVETIELTFDKSDRVGQFSQSALNLIRDLVVSAPGSLNVPVERA